MPHTKDHLVLRLHKRLLFGLASPPLQMSANVVGFFFNAFLLEVAKIHPFHCSLILLVGRVWDALTDPIVGYLVSQTHTRYGRCRPWLLVSTPLGVTVFFFLWYTPTIATVSARFFYYFVLYLLFNTFITVSEFFKYVFKSSAAIKLEGIT